MTPSARIPWGSKLKNFPWSSGLRPRGSRRPGFSISDILKRYFVKQYGHIAEYYAVDKTALRTFLCGRIDEIIEITD